ncbi:MAG TPA: carboxylesterase family protein [Candidatus Acidoferrales bacterium]|nr:carboxylesterase family protein [Candidatus Acidoferrales bacterium]
MKEKKQAGGNSSNKKLSRRTMMRGAAALAGGTAATVLAPAVSMLAPEVHAAPKSMAGGETIVTASPKKNIVETDSGKVFGFVSNGIVTFKGMPYGASTAGKNRFMPPAKPEPWAGVRSALYWGPVSPQNYTSTFDGRRNGWNHDDESFMFEWEDGQPSEDCLRINVWTPSINDNKKRPVLMWIHGGGFTSGSDNELRMYDGESLARRGDVVMVSVNHRLGVLGYMNLIEYGEQYASSPNVGMMDLVAALEWVKTNISNFGGDPNSVLIFGQSGGGGKVSALMGMPSAEGLFHRAVVESGASLRQSTLDRSAQTAAGVIAELGLSKDSISKIHDLPDHAIVQAAFDAGRRASAAARGRGRGPGGGGGAWGPVVDGKVLPRNSFDPDAPSYAAKVPLIVGSVLNEMANAVQMGDASVDAWSMDEMKSRLSAQRGQEKSEHLIAVFQKLHPTATPFEIYSRISGMSGRVGALTMAQRKAAQGTAPAYNYWFQWQSPILDGRGRAFHCSELPFVFYNTERCARMTGNTPEARDLAARVSDAWVSFARKGDPNHPGLPAWPKYNAEIVPTMVFDTKCAAVDDPDGEGRKAVMEATATA